MYHHLLVTRITNFYYVLAIVAGHALTYSRHMADQGKSKTYAKRSSGSFEFMGRQVSLMKSLLSWALFTLVLCMTASAKELPNAPSATSSADPGLSFVESSSQIQPVIIEHTKTVDVKFLSLAVVSTGSTFADAYTTLFARENWLAGKKGVCNIEVQSAYLYGTHPTVARAYAVASVKSAGSIFAAYYLRKHHSKFWSLPLIANSVIGLEGVTQNMMACN